MTTKKIKTSDILGDNYYIYELTSSDYTPALNDTITITCTMKDVYGTAASGKSITLYQNGTSKGTQTTNNNGVATWSITCSTAGLQKFNIKDRNIEVFVNNILDDFTIKTFTETLKGVDGGGGIYVYNTVVGDWEINLDLTNFNGNELVFHGLDYNFTISEGSYYARPCLVVEATGYGTIYLTDSYALYDDISSITISYTSSTKRIYINMYQDNTLIDDTDFFDRLNQFGTVTIYSDGILEGTVTSNLQVPIHYDSFDKKDRIDGDCILVYDITFMDNNSDPSNYTFVNFTFGEYNGVYRYNNKIYLINEYKDYNNFNGFEDFIESYPVLTTDRQFTVKRYYLTKRAVITEWNDTISIIERMDWYEGDYDNIYNANDIDEDESSFVQLASKYIFSDVKSVKSTANELKTLINNKEDSNNKVNSWSSTPTDTHYPSEKLVKDSLDNKQEKLISGTNLKTLNGVNLLGKGDIVIDMSCSSSNILFEDKSDSASGLSNYGSSVLIRGTDASATIEYNSTENAYKISGTGNYFAGIPIDPLKDVDNFKLTAEMKCATNSGDCQIGFYTRDYTDTTKQAYSTHLLGDARYRWFYVTPSANGSYQAVNTSSAHYSSYTKMEWIVEGTSIKMNIYDSNDDVAYTITKDTATYDKHEFGFWIDTERGTSYACYVKNIKAESLDGDSTVLFEDACDSANGLSDYDSSVAVRGSSSAMTMIYDSTENAYKCSGSGNWYSIIPIPALNDKDQYIIEADFKIQNISETGIGLCIDNRNDSTSYSYACWIEGGSGKYIGKQFNLNTDGTVNQYYGLNLSSSKWYRIEMIINGDSLTGNLYDGNTLISTDSTTLTVNNSQMGIFLMTQNGTTNSACWVKNIKARPYSILFEDGGVTGNVNTDYTNVGGTINTSVSTTGTNISCSTYADCARIPNVKLSGDFEITYTLVALSGPGGGFFILNNNTTTSNCIAYIEANSSEGWNINYSGDQWRTVSASLPYNVKIKRIGSTFTIYVNGTQINQRDVTSNDIYIGWKTHSANGRNYTFKDFVIKKYGQTIDPKNTIYFGDDIMTMIDIALEHMITNWEDYN